MNENPVLADEQRPPSLAPLIADVERALLEKGELGLLSITVLRREDCEDVESWTAYESILSEISSFLTRFIGSQLRRSDVALDPIVAGNSYVLLLGPPREDRPLDHTDLTRVRHRLIRGLREHLEQHAQSGSLQRYGVYAGAALVRHTPTVDTQRVIYHGLEQAFADALGQRKKEGLRNAVHLQRILNDRQVGVVYQPLIDLSEHRVIGVEALTRMPRGQFRTPDLLFKVASENGALWALERLCRGRALENLPRLQPDQRLFLNVEPDSFHDPELCAPSFVSRVEAAGLSPHQIVLELTEHTAVKDFSALRRALDTVRAVGYRLAMDDVGSGYAGLQTIAEIRPDYIKLDMTLVRDLHLDPIKRELIATIRRFSDRTGITMIAEGVEQLEELEMLARTGVRCAQGFLFARPGAPPEEPDWDRLDAVLAGAEVELTD